MISAIILAAGESKRMGRPKMLLKWGKTILIRHVISIYQDAGVEDILLVTGANHEAIIDNINDLGIRTIHNTFFATGEMLSSIQTGLLEMTESTEAALIGLGDQPQVESGSVRQICETYYSTHSPIVVPSLQNKRLHPWLVERSHWKEILELEHPNTAREFLSKNYTQIKYVELDDEGLLADLDTPSDYQRWKP